MIKPRLISLIFFVLFSSAVFAAVIDPSLSNIKEDKAHVIIIPKADAKNGMQRVSSAVSQFEESKLNSVDSNFYTATLSQDEIKALSEDSSIEGIYQDNKVEIFLNYSAPQIGANKAWNLSFDGTHMNGSGQTVCVIDTGVYYNHPALGADFGPGHVVVGGWDYINDDNDPSDDNGHGTHVAGIIASRDSQFRGIAPGANIVAIKVMYANGTGFDSTIVKGIDWCINNSKEFNISVISMSLGGGSYSNYCDSLILPQYAQLINKAVGLNIPVVIASGNSGSSINIAEPACVKNATAVGAVNKLDQIAGFTNDNFMVDFMAPGVLINSTKLYGGFKNISGTSMATPHVAAAFTLLQQYKRWETGQNITFNEAYQALRNSSINIFNPANSNTYQRINVYRALLEIDHMNPYATFVAPTPSPNSTIYSSFMVRVSATENLANATLIINGQRRNMTSNGMVWSYNVNASLGNYSYFVAIYDLAGNYYETETRYVSVTEYNMWTFNYDNEPYSGNGPDLNFTPGDLGAIWVSNNQDYIAFRVMASLNRTKLCNGTENISLVIGMSEGRNISGTIGEFNKADLLVMYNETGNASLYNYDSGTRKFVLNPATISSRFVNCRNDMAELQLAIPLNTTDLNNRSEFSSMTFIPSTQFNGTRIDQLLPGEEGMKFSNCNGNLSLSGYVTPTGINGLFISSFPSWEEQQQNQSNCVGFSEVDATTGFYNITGLYTGNWDVHIEPPINSDYGSIDTRNLEITRNLRRNFTLTTGSSINGTITVPNGFQTRDMFVNAFKEDGYGGTGTRAQNNGAFRLRGLTAGSWSLEVNPPPESGLSRKRIEHIMIVSNGTNVEQNLTLTTGAVVNGTVTDGSSGLSQVRVFMFRNNGCCDYGETVTNSDGRFMITGLGSGEYRIIAEPRSISGYGRVERIVELVSEQGLEVNFTLRSGNRIRGHVGGSDGTPNLGGVGVSIFKKNEGRPEELESGDYTFTMTSQNGTYNVAGLNSGNFTVSVFTDSSGWSNYASTQKEVSLSSGTLVVNFNLTQGVLINGTIMKSGNIPVNDGFVNAFVPSSSPNQPPSSFGWSEIRNGRYNVRGLKPSLNHTIFVQVFESGIAGATANVMTPESGYLEKNFTLSSGGSVKGKVVDGNGVAISRADVHLWKEAGSGFGFTQTKSDGTFRMDGLASGNNYQLFVEKRSTNYAPINLEGITVTAGSTLDVGTLTMSTGLNLTGYVLQSSVGISNAEVKAWSRSSRGFGSATSSSDGSYSIAGLPSGAYDMFVQKSDGEFKFVNNVTLNSTLTEHNITFSTGSIVNVNGTVINSSNGARISGARVDMFNPTLHQGRTNRTGSDGLFTLYKLKEGAGYGLAFFKEGYYINFTNTTPGKNLTLQTEFNITLKKISNSSYISGNVTGNNSSNVLVLVINRADTSFTKSQTTTDRYNITDLPSGSYIIKAVKGSTIKTYSSYLTLPPSRKNINFDMR